MRVEEEVTFWTIGVRRVILRGVTLCCHFLCLIPFSHHWIFLSIARTRCRIFPLLISLALFYCIKLDYQEAPLCFVATFHFYVGSKYHYPWIGAVWSGWYKLDSYPIDVQVLQILVWLPDECKAFGVGLKKGSPSFWCPHFTPDLGKGGRTRCLWLSVSTNFPNVSVPYLGAGSLTQGHTLFEFPWDFLSTTSPGISVS